MTVVWTKLAAAGAWGCVTPTLRRSATLPPRSSNPFRVTPVMPSLPSHVLLAASSTFLCTAALKGTRPGPLTVSATSISCVLSCTLMVAEDGEGGGGGDAGGLGGGGGGMMNSRGPSAQAEEGGGGCGEGFMGQR